MRVVDDKIEQKYGGRIDKLEFVGKETRLFGWKRIKRYDHSKSATGVDRLSRYWHVVFFSASVLLGIRIKKEWIQVIPPTSRPGQSSFIKMLTLEWLLGIALYLVFALLVKGSRFRSEERRVGKECRL